MFTGIVSGVGTVVQAGAHRLTIKHAPTAGALKLGASVAINGCCLTVVGLDGPIFKMDVVPETLKRTTLGALQAKDRVNLELPLSAGSLIDGHLVQGHVDARAEVRAVKGAAAGKVITLELPKGIADFVAEKGSIAVDGVSLTVVGTDDKRQEFTVALIPHTLKETIAKTYKRGSKVNLEADVMARYAGRILRRS